jgi:hypothetical protein
VTCKTTKQITETLQLLLEITGADKLNRSLFFESNGKKYVCHLKKVNKKRSVPQNKLMWAWYSALSEHISGDKNQVKDDLHECYKRKFLPWRHVNYSGMDYYLPGSTKDLDTQGFSTYLKNIQQDAMNFHGYQLLFPGDENFDEFYAMYGLN